MNISGRTIGEIIGASAVVVSLIFVGIELSQSNTIAGRESRSEIAALFANVNQLTFEDPTLSSLKVKLRSQHPDLTNEEAEQAFSLAGIYANTWGAANSAVAAGMVPPEIVEIWAGEVSLVFRNYPGICPFFRSYMFEGREAIEGRNGDFYDIVRAEVDRLSCSNWAFL